MFNFSFLVVSGLQRVLNDGTGNLLSNHWPFTMLEGEVFKYNFVNIYIAETVLYILLKFIQWMFSK